MSQNFLQIQKEFLQQAWTRKPEELEIALYYIFYLQDEEFSSAVTCLFPANATKFLPVAGLADVAEYTARKIIELVRED